MERPDLTACTHDNAPAVYTVPDVPAGTRLDQWLTGVLPDRSRARIQQLIRSGHIQLNGAACKAHHPVHVGDSVSVTIPAPAPVELQPEAIPLDVLLEDEAILVLNKPAGLVVHPAAGHDSGTLVNALLHHCPDLPGIGGEQRPGIVHRLDRDTSGVMVVAKTEAAMQSLTSQFKDRHVRKQYIALVRGKLIPESGRIETLIGRHPHDRKKMSAQIEHGRNAVTHYTTRESFADEASLLDITIETGRTHQIRVHMAHLGHPVLGDRDYGRAHTLTGGVPVPRQMLHAARLAFTHPVNGHPVDCTAPLPDDLQTLLTHLRHP